MIRNESEASFPKGTLGLIFIVVEGRTGELTRGCVCVETCMTVSYQEEVNRHSITADHIDGQSEPYLPLPLCAFLCCISVSSAGLTMLLILQPVSCRGFIELPSKLERLKRKSHERDCYLQYKAKPFSDVHGI